MKLSIAAVATVFALSSPAFAQDHLNGSTLGQSQPGYNSGVPYPNPAAVDDPVPAAPDAAPDRAAPVDAGSAKVQGAATPKPRKKSSKSAKKAVPAKDKVTVTPTNSPSPGAASPH